MHRTYGSRIRRYINVESSITQIIRQRIDQSRSIFCFAPEDFGIYRIVYYVVTRFLVPSFSAVRSDVDFFIREVASYYSVQLLQVQINASWLLPLLEYHYDEYHVVVKRIGIRDLPPYSCRHTYGTEAVKLGAHPAVIQKMLRHSNTKTQEKYTHLGSDEVHSVANQLKKM